MTLKGQHKGQRPAGITLPGQRLAGTILLSLSSMLKWAGIYFFILGIYFFLFRGSVFNSSSASL